MNPAPLVSIITPVYNGEKYLEETLRSVFAQTYTNYELIVIDDGSPSRECEKICQKYPGKLKYISQKNTGLSGARNRGLRDVKGDYIAFIDQDDLWHSEKLEKQVKLFESLREKGVSVGLIYTPLIEIDGDGRETGRSSYHESGNLFPILIYSNHVGTPSSVLVRKDVFDRCGTFDEKTLSYSDWELFIRIAFDYEIHCLNEHLTRYRVAHGGLSENLDLMEDDVLRISRLVWDSYQEFFLKKGITREAYFRPILRDVAETWKLGARRRLTVYRDGPGFRRYLRRGWARDRGVIGLKIWAYVALSYLSVPLCLKIKRLRGKI